MSKYLQMRNTLVDITLSGTSPDGGPIDFIITSNPGYGDLQNVDGSPIGSLPYMLASDQVRYIPDSGYIGIDLFTYIVSNDLDSLEATVFYTCW